MITHENLISNLLYDPDTGNFVWRKRSPRADIGSIAGSICTNGYISITVKQHRYLAHRLAWFYIHKKWPIAEIDHINHARDDNRIDNLRESTVAENRSNRIRKKDGLKGAYFNHKNGRRKWRSQITVNGKQTIIGLFHTEIEAHQAYCEYASSVRKEFFCDGKIVQNFPSG